MGKISWVKVLTETWRGKTFHKRRKSSLRCADLEKTPRGGEWGGVLEIPPGPTTILESLEGLN